jgi:hypothetical protein
LGELERTREKKMEFNRELDSLIAVLKEVDRIEYGIGECERNTK